MRRKSAEVPVLILNIIGIVLLVILGWKYVSFSPEVNNPGAMLPMKEWEAAGILLSAGTIPLLCANYGAYLFVWKERVKGWKRLLFFLPGMICFLIAAHYWLFSSSGR
ncbi:MAG: hypothetical protein IKE16_06895 [Solobacterium sp.]|nr:hypothetical protein [Solobacterium sp.]